LDILHLNEKVISLAACIWAACGKDPGFTPELMLDMINRHAVFTPDLLAAEALVRPIDARKLKSDFLGLLEKSRQTLKHLDPNQIGCLYFDKKGQVVKNLDKLNGKKWSLHYGTVKGSWPRIVE